MKDNGNDRVVDEIMQGLEHVDKSVKVKTPGIGHFRQMVARVEEQKKERQKKETFLFMAITISVLCLETYVFSRSFNAFVIAQIFAIVLLLSGSIISYKRKNEWRGNL